VRLEQKGAKGFEDRTTFNVVSRNWAGTTFKQVKRANRQEIQTRYYSVLVPNDAKTLDGVKVISPMGTLLYEYKGVPKSSYFPNPGQIFGAWVMADAPRIVPPAWGASPAKVATKLADTSGWDLGNNAPDIYVFVNRGSGYNGLRKDFIALTGPTPMPPLYLFGFIDSRWHAYTEDEAISSIDEYRKRQIPLDVLVCDTDWRKNGSHGYEINDALFPNMPRFFANAHARNVKVMFNDHPEPVSPKATDPLELQYRSKNLTTLLSMGLDLWWYDRNWGTHIGTPVEGLPLEVWGMRVYTDITQQLRPNQRPAVMTNAWGIDNGIRNGNSYPAAHRYPIWWTGDTSSKWEFLQKGIENGVDMGAIAMLPYVHEDLGGFGGSPSPELYVRFLQYGSLSPITRVHCGWGLDRHPWAYGENAEKIVSAFIKLRYRLLPTLYSAARQNYDSGIPILRRCDLFWPTYKEASSSTQYLLGNDLLVAPIYEGLNNQFEVIPKELLRSPQNDEGLEGAYFDNIDLEGNPTMTRVDSRVAFDWSDKSPSPAIKLTDYSVRWTGKVGPVPETGEYDLVVRADDGVRLWINGEKVIDAWVPQDDVAQTAKVKLEQGKSYEVKLEYFQGSGHAICQFGWRKPSESKSVVTRSMWVPPGKWQDLWTGHVHAGPATIKVESPLWHLPLFARVGGLVILGPDVQYTSEKPWDTLTLEAFLPEADGIVKRELYEDDGASNAYRVGGFRRTTATLKRVGTRVLLTIDPVQGGFPKALQTRSWIVRFRLPANEHYKGIKLNGVGHSAIKITPSYLVGIGAIPLQGSGSHPPVEAGDIFELRIPTTDVSKGQKIELFLSH
jgi:alpha-glucosidase (family GH31 glycosyl hydrolase)